LTRKLEQLEKKDREFDAELGKIRKAPELLTVRGGVVPCASWLLGALILSGVAWYLSDIQIFIGIIPVLIWVLGLAAIVYSISRIYQCLRVIEGVAITSEEAALKRTVEAFKMAERELEEEKKPKLELKFEGAQPPFHITCGGQIEAEFLLALMKGEVARRAEVAFFAPLGFEFPGKDTWLQSKEHKQVGGYITTSIEYGDLTKGIKYGRTITIEAPSSPGSFTLKYNLICEGFHSDYQQFEVIVTPAQQESP
jgi:hypothetical protein